MDKFSCRLVILLILMFWSTQVMSSNPPPEQSTSPQYCRFKNKEYTTGDVWYPTTSPSSGMACIVCICLSSGRKNCTKRECPTDCYQKPTHLQHPCCNMCHEQSDSFQSGMQQQMNGGQESGEEEDDGDVGAENSEFVSCLHQGQIYRDGESFTANVTGLPIHAVGQCMQCVCQRGMVLCQMKTCSSFKCPKYGESLAHLATQKTHDPSSEACCQQCEVWRKPRSDGNLAPAKELFELDLSMSETEPGESNNFGDQQQRPNPMISSSVESSITFREVGSSGPENAPGPSAPQGQLDDCVSSGRYYMQGSTWHPIVGPFGAMECVTCSCFKGQIVCGRLKCPLKKEMPCPKPVKVEGHCCPICVPTLSNVIGVSEKMCVPGRQDVTALKAHGVGANNTELISFAFLKDSQVDLHEWTVPEGDDTLVFVTRYISLQQFNSIKTRQRFTLLGATNDKNLDKFSRREKKLEKRCVPRWRCSARISSLERSLRIHRLIARQQCLSHERRVSI